MSTNYCVPSLLNHDLRILAVNIEKLRDRHAEVKTKAQAIKIADAAEQLCTELYAISDALRWSVEEA